MSTEPETAPSNNPFALRVGAVGFGIGVGCGVGVGVGKPLSLHGIPGVSSAASGISQGVSALLSPFSGVTQPVRTAVQQATAGRGDMGFGCGIGIGYGYGAGLMLKPSALAEIQRVCSEAVQSVTTKLQAVMPKLPDGGGRRRLPPSRRPVSDISHHKWLVDLEKEKDGLESQVARLKRQNKQLRAAVCRIRPKDPVCSRSADWESDEEDCAGHN